MNTVLYGISADQLLSIVTLHHQVACEQEEDSTQLCA